MTGIKDGCARSVQFYLTSKPYTQGENDDKGSPYIVPQTSSVYLPMIVWPTYRRICGDVISFFKFNWCRCMSPLYLYILTLSGPGLPPVYKQSVKISYNALRTLFMATPGRSSLTPSLLKARDIIIQRGRVKVAIPRYDLKERCGQVRRTLSTVLSR